MKIFFTVLGTIGWLISFSVNADYQPFQIKIKPDSALASIHVIANGNLEKYSAAEVNVNQWRVEARGQLTLNESLSGFRIKQAQIRYGAVNGFLQNYNIAVSGDKRSLTGNSGRKWEEHTITLSEIGSMQPYIDACNNAVEGDLAGGLTMTQALNKNRSIIIDQADSSFRAGLRINVSESPNYLTEEAAVNLPVRVFCEATGYVKPLPTASNSLSIVAGITDSHLTILEQVSQFSGTCKITLSGMIKTNLPNTAVQFQYEHSNGKKSDIKSVTTSHAKTVMFSHTYNIDNNPYDDEAGSIRLSGVSHDFQSDWKTYTMRCEEPATSSFQAETPPQLLLSVVVRETQLIKGQICPKDVLIKGSVTAGSSIEGHAIFIGSGTSMYQSETMPYDLNISEHKKFFRVREVALPSTLGSLQAINNSDPVLQRITITQGMSLMDENNEMIATTGQQSYTFHCSWPQVNPNMPGSNTLGMAPDHTGGGGAPTSLTGKSPFSRENDNNKAINAGLRSDGELVQARKPLQLLRRELSHTGQQQGSVLLDADDNETSQTAHQQQQKNVPAGAVPIPYPIIAKKVDEGGNNLKWGLNDVYVPSFSTNTTSSGRSDTRDRFANQQSSHQAHTIPLENATTASIRSSQLDNRSTQTTLLRGKVGDPCKKSRFPKNTVINQSGQQRVAECVKGKVVVNKTKKAQRLWKRGDPVLFSPDNRQAPKKEIRSGDLSDEMPEDLPAG